MDFQTTNGPRRKRHRTPGYSAQNFWLPDQMKAEIRRIAREGRVSMSELAEDALARYFGAKIHTLYMQSVRPEESSNGHES